MGAGRNNEQGDNEGIGDREEHTKCHQLTLQCFPLMYFFQRVNCLTHAYLLTHTNKVKNIFFILFVYGIFV